MTPINYNNPNEMWRHNGYDPYKGLSDEERLKAGCLQLFSFIGAFIAALLICALFGSCKTIEYVPVIEHKTDTVLCHSTKHDSIWVHDSIHVTEKGDTVRIEKWHTKYIEKQVHDTLYQSKTDTIPHPYPVTEYVEKPLSKIEKGLMGVGILTLMALVIFVAMKIKRFLS